MSAAAGASPGVRRLVEGAVDLFLTIGSPLGTPKLVYEHLAPHLWPNVMYGGLRLVS